MPLTDEQYRGMKILKERIKNKERISILQGYAGSGKTYTLSHLLRELPNASVHFCAFTGTAAKLLMDSGLKASTIHKLIYRPIVQFGRVVGFKKEPYEALQYLDLIVVDEYSMVNDILMSDLESYGVPILLVGDPFQLPPIGKANKYINGYNVLLKEPMRQALDSPILWAATQIRKGETLKEGVYGNILKVGRKHELDSEWLRKDVQFLCGTNATRRKLNTEISGSPTPFVGDKIIFLRNDWDYGIVNGAISKIQRISKRSNYFIIDFMYDGQHYEDYKVYFPQMPENHRFSKWKPSNAFDKAYAITTHKAQGQTIRDPMVIVDESYVFGKDKDRHLYTALTRATGEKPVALLR